MTKGILQLLWNYLYKERGKTIPPTVKTMISIRYGGLLQTISLTDSAILTIINSKELYNLVKK